MNNMKWWLLSLVDTSGEFVGVCICQGVTFEAALMSCKWSGTWTSETTDAKGILIPEEVWASLRPEWVNRKLTRAEAEEIDRTIGLTLDELPS